MSVGVRVSVGGGVTVEVFVAVAVGEKVAVEVGNGVLVFDGTKTEVPGGVLVGGGEDTKVLVAVGVDVRVGIKIKVRVGANVVVGVADGAEVGVGVRVATDKVAVGVGVLGTGVLVGAFSRPRVDQMSTGPPNCGREGVPVTPSCGRSRAISSRMAGLTTATRIYGHGP